MQKVSTYLAQLGEGALWDYRTGELFWVDLSARRLLRYHPQSGSQKIIQLEEEIGTVVPAGPGQALVALETGVFRIELESQRLEKLADNPNPAETRFNDGKCDPAGRFWVGTIDRLHRRPLAALYCLDERGCLERKVGQVTNSNGIIWSRDRQAMYYIDTPTQKVVRYPFDLASGALGSPRVVIELDPALGRPDGCTLDAEGMLWIALWAGGAVTRWDPSTGKLLARLEVPALNVTSVAFGGPRLATLYITTARVGMTEEQLCARPLAGGLFATEPGVHGLPASFYGERTDG